VRRDEIHKECHEVDEHKIIFQLRLFTFTALSESPATMVIVAYEIGVFPVIFAKQKKGKK
jgi:hypothetical protein